MPEDTYGLIPMPKLASALLEAGYEPAPDYRDCYTAAASARFPAKNIRGRWYVNPRDYPKIAAAMNMRHRTGGKRAV